MAYISREQPQWKKTHTLAMYNVYDTQDDLKKY